MPMPRRQRARPVRRPPVPDGALLIVYPHHNIERLDAPPAPDYREEILKCKIERSNKYKLTSLKTLCIRNIADHIDTYWGKDFDENVRNESPFPSLLLGPFEWLPPLLIDSILVEAKIALGNRFLQYADLFITSNLQALNLDNYMKIQRLLTTVKNKCQRYLREFSLVNCRVTTSAKLLDVLTPLQNLISLNLSENVTINNAILTAIANNMHSLRELNLKRTTVTDVGLNCLCTGRYHSIRKLSLDFCFKVSANGIYNVLCSFPDMYKLEHETLADALFIWKTSCPYRETNLTNLFIHIASLDQASADFNSLIRLCPLMNTLHVVDSAHLLTERQSFPCFNFETIHSLILFGITPWFSSESLTKLEMTDVDDVNLNTIMSAFPNIEKLHFTLCNFNISPISGTATCVKKNIKELYLSEIKDIELCLSLRELISSEYLKKLTILKSDISEEYFDYLATNIHFKHLISDYSLNSYDLEHFILRNKNLETITIKNSDGIHNDDSLVLPELANSNYYYRTLLTGKAKINERCFQ